MSTMRTRASYTSGRTEGLPGRRSWMPVLVRPRRRVVGLMPRSPHSFATARLPDTDVWPLREAHR